MKRYLLAVISIACLFATSCTNKNIKANNDSENQYIVGAYADYRSLDDEDRQLFASTYTHKSKLTPQSVATQVVAGTNYKFICTDDSENVVKVVIFKPLPDQGEPKVLSIEPETEYDEIIASVKKGLGDGWQSKTPEDLGVSYIYQYKSPSMGYAKKDINEDGIYELILGDSMSDNYAIYDIFTYDTVAGKVKHIFCGGERDRCVFNGSGVICRSGSNSASDSFTKYYKIEDGELMELKDTGVQEDLLIIDLEPFKK
jgi:hypothetical protein